MKKTIVSLAMLFLIGGTVIAQDSKTTGTIAPANTARPRTAEAMSERRKGPSAEARAKQATEELNGKVSLTKEQYEKVYALNLEFMKERIASKPADKAEMTEADRAKMQEARKANNQKIKALLTAEQLEKLKAANKEKRAENNGSAKIKAKQ